MARIITSNIEDEFNKSKTVFQKNLSPIEQAVAKRVGRVIRGSTTPSSTRVVESFFTPFLERTTIELPTSLKDKMKWRRYFFENEPIVGAACELHAMYPLSTFWISHEDPVVRQDFEDMSEDLELFEFLLDMLLEYWVMGECVVPGTKITLADNSVKNIEDLQQGEKVITHLGQKKPVSLVMKRFVDEEIYKIKVSGLSEPLCVTKNHPVFVYQKKKDGSFLSSAKFVEVERLQVGDYLTFPVLPNFKYEGDYFAIFENRFLSSITSIERVFYKGPVYNLEVEEDHSYIANNVAVHNCFPYGFFDDAKDPSVWTEFILLDPMKVDVKWEPLVRGKRKELISLEPSDTLKQIVDAGPNDEKTGDLYKMLSSDIIESIRTSVPLRLNNLQASHLKRKSNYFSARGTSIIDRCFKILAYRDKLRSAQYAMADRHISPREFYFLGSDAEPASQDEIDDFRDLLAQQWSQPNQAIIYHHAVRVQWEGAAGRILPLQPEFQYIDKQLFIALLINEGVLTAERQPYASTSVALDVMIQRYLNIRMRVQNWIENKVFAPICEIHKIYKRTKGELEHRIRFNSSTPRLWVPRVKWDKEELRNDLNKMRFLSELVDKGWISKDMVLPFLNIDPDVARRGIKETRVKDQKAGISAAPGGMMGPGGVGGFAEPGEMPSAPPEVGLTEEETNLPAAPGEEGGAMPPESHEGTLPGEEGSLPTSV